MRRVWLRKPGPNHARLFWACPSSAPQRGCELFLWADEEFPRCQCGTASTMRRVLKPGDNNGRYFFGCRRRTGGCGFFQWAVAAAAAAASRRAPLCVLATSGPRSQKRRHGDGDADADADADAEVPGGPRAGQAAKFTWDARARKFVQLRGGGGESFLRVHWVAVPKALRARRVNRWAGLPAAAASFAARRQGAPAGVADVTREEREGRSHTQGMMHVCMLYVCVYVFEYVCMCVCMYVQLYVAADSAAAPHRSRRAHPVATRACAGEAEAGPAEALAPRGRHVGGACNSAPRQARRQPW
eukprot:COSAG01_NODE_275_length_19669_cov_8.676188_14_plen_300_part_00